MSSVPSRSQNASGSRQRSSKILRSKAHSGYDDDFEETRPATASYATVEKACIREELGTPESFGVDPSGADQLPTTLEGTELDEISILQRHRGRVSIKLKMPIEGTFYLNVWQWRLTFKDQHIEDMYVVSRCQTIRTCTIACFLGAVVSFVSFGISRPSNFGHWTVWLHLVVGTLQILLGIVNIVGCESYPRPSDSLPLGGESTKKKKKDKSLDEYGNPLEPVITPRHGPSRPLPEEGGTVILSGGFEEVGNGNSGEDRGFDDFDGANVVQTDDPDTRLKLALESTRLTHAEFYKLCTVVAARAEIIAVLLVLSPMILAAVHPFAQLRCLNEDRTSLGTVSSIYDCVYPMYPVSFLVPLLGLLVVNVRFHIFWPVMLSYSLLLLIMELGFGIFSEARRGTVGDTGAPLSQVVPVLVVSCACVVASLASERFYRRGFVTNLLLHEKEYAAELHRKYLKETLRSILPGGAVAKLAAGIAVEDYSEWCTLSVCEVKDFNYWSGTVTPEFAMESVDVLFSTFDSYLEMAKSSTTVHKVIMTGDIYICASGLRGHGTSSGPDGTNTTASSASTAIMGDSPETVVARTVCTLDCCRMAGRQLTFAACTQSYGLRVGVGISRGASYGSVLGNTYLRYNVAGPAFNQARKLALFAEDNRAYIDAQTVSGLSGAAQQSAMKLEEAPGVFMDEETNPKNPKESVYRIVIFPAPRPPQNSKPYQKIQERDARLRQQQAFEEEEQAAADFASFLELHGSKRKERANRFLQRPKQVARGGKAPSAKSSEDTEGARNRREVEAMRMMHERNHDGVGFVLDETEEEYWRTVGTLYDSTSSLDSETKIDLLVSFIVGISLLHSSTFQEIFTVASIAFICLGACLAPLRYVLRRRLPSDSQWIPFFMLAVQNSFFFTATAFYSPRGTHSTSHPALILVMSFGAVFANGSLPWYLSIPMAVFHLAGGVVVSLFADDTLSRGNSEYTMRQLLRFIPSTLALAIFVLGAYKMEDERRVYFTSRKLSSTVTSMLQTKMENNKRVLKNMMPDYVVDDAVLKVKHGRLCVLQTLLDCVILAVRVSTPSLEHLLRQAENERIALEQARKATAAASNRPNNGIGGPGSSTGSDSESSVTVTNVAKTIKMVHPSAGAGVGNIGGKGSMPAYGRQTTENARNKFSQTLREVYESIELVLDEAQAALVHCNLIHVVGDTVVLGGPLINMKAEKAKLAKSVEEMQQWKTLGQRQVFERAAGACAKVMIKCLSSLRHRYGRRLTAALAYGSGYACVLGQYIPSFDLLGHAVRAGTEVLEAAPDGFLCCTEGFNKLLNFTSQSRIWDKTGFVCEKDVGWRLRGAGMMRIHPLKKSTSKPDKKSLTFKDPPTPVKIRTDEDDESTPTSSASPFTKEHNTDGSTTVESVVSVTGGSSYHLQSDDLVVMTPHNEGVSSARSLVVTDSSVNSNSGNTTTAKTSATENPLVRASSSGGNSGGNSSGTAIQRQPSENDAAARSMSAADVAEVEEIHI